MYRKAALPGGKTTGRAALVFDALLFLFKVSFSEKSYLLASKMASTAFST